MGFNQLYIDTLGLTGWSFGLSFAVLLTSLWFGFPLLNGVCISLCTGLSSWHTVIMPGSVSYYLISLFFGVWGLLFSLFPPSFGALSLYPYTYNLVRFFGRMVTESNCFFWMTHLGICYFCFWKIIVDFCCCLCRRCLSLPYTIFVFPCFCMWTGSVSIYLSLSHLHPSPELLTCPICLCMCLIWECCDCFDWSLCCIRRLLIGWITFFGSLVSLLVMWCAHIWLRIISVL